MTGSSRLGITGTASRSWAYLCLQNWFAACLGALHRLPASPSPCKDTADTQPHQRSPWTEVSSESLLWWGTLSCLNAQAAPRCSWGEESRGQGTRHSPGHSSLVPADPAELHSCRDRHLETVEHCLYLIHLQTRRKFSSLTYVSYFYLRTGHGVMLNQEIPSLIQWPVTKAWPDHQRVFPRVGRHWFLPDADGNQPCLEEQWWPYLIIIS